MVGGNVGSVVFVGPRANTNRPAVSGCKSGNDKKASCKSVDTCMRP